MKENVRDKSEKQENMRLNSVNSKKITGFKINCVTGDFDWLKTCQLETKIEWKTIKNYWIFHAIKKLCFVFCIYKVYLMSAKGYKNAVAPLLIERKLV